MTTPNLYQMCVRWNRGVSDPLRGPNYVGLLKHIDAHAKLRYADYAPFVLDEQPFIRRLHSWLLQVTNQRHQRALLELVRWIMFLDDREVTALYRDVHRRIIVPWVTPRGTTIEDQLAATYDQTLLERLQTYDFYSITESFHHKLYENVNGLAGLRKPTILGEDAKRVPATVEKSKDATGVIVLEDIVGTGGQAARILRRVADTLGSQKPILFAPLVLLEKAQAPKAPLTKLNEVAVHPATVIPSRLCLTETPHPDEPSFFKQVRSVIKATAERVLERLNSTDDPPDNAFGYGGSGALLVTHQNTPNNTVPLIHHKAPQWEPLFRRTHHSYEAKKT